MKEPIIESKNIRLSKHMHEFMPVVERMGKEGWWVACLIPECDPTTWSASSEVLFQRYKPDGS